MMSFQNIQVLSAVVVEVQVLFDIVIFHMRFFLSTVYLCISLLRFYLYISMPLLGGCNSSSFKRKRLSFFSLSSSNYFCETHDDDT